MKKPGEIRRARGTPPIVFARVRNAMKRKGVAPFLKRAVCVKSPEVSEKKPVAGLGVCAPS